MDTAQIEDLDAVAALRAFGDLRRERARAERDILVLATHFAYLYNVDSMDLDGPTLPGTERPVRVAGEGAPLVREFAIAEMATELATTTHAARTLIGDGLELRHRLPRLWARVLACEVPVWVARKIAQATRGLTLEQAATVDAALAEIADGRVPYRVLFDNLDAAVIAADPDAAAERERAAAEEEFAKVGQSTAGGRKTLYVKTSAAQMARIDATIAYLADALRTLGDHDTEDRRRTRAVLILANPTEALRLLQAHATHTQTNTPGTPGTGAGTDGTGAGSGPAYDDTDAPLPDPDPDPDAAPDPAEPEPADPDRDAPDPPPPGGPDPGVGVGFTTPFHPHQIPACPCRGGTYLPDLTRLLPTVTLYLHLDATHQPDTTHGPDGTPTLGASGVARWEDHGPISAAHVREFLGPHARFVIKPVIDLAHQAPSAGYEVRGRLREAVHLRNPLDAFPYAANTTRHQQIDHTTPYTHEHDGVGAGEDAGDDAGTGGAGSAQPQTRIDNLAPMTTYHHRLKTHGGWTMAQPFHGIYLWKSPHGAIFLVDHTGTRQIRRPHHPNQAANTPRDVTAPGPNSRPQPADLFWDLINTAA